MEDMEGVHVCVYTADFGGLYERLQVGDMPSGGEISERDAHLHSHARTNTSSYAVAFFGHVFVGERADVDQSTLHAP